MGVPTLILNQPCTFGSLENVAQGVRVGLRNRLEDAAPVGVSRIAVGGDPLSLDGIRFEMGDGTSIAPSMIVDGAALSSFEWVSSREKYGRNR